MKTLKGTSAWRAAAANPNGRWSDTEDRFLGPFYRATHTPQFPLSQTDRFFCIGSCFARNIEEHLIYRNIAVESRRIIAPRTEISARPNGLVNKYTTHAIAQELEWVVSPPETYGHLVLETEAGWRDLLLAPTISPVTQERAEVRRRYISETYFHRLRSVDVVILTLGLNEVWRDNLLGIWLNAPPGLSNVRREPERFSIYSSDVPSNLEALETTHARLKAINPHVRIVVTVSPVPMGVTFFDQDISVANANSKAVLRSAAQTFANTHSDVDYFPSYEMVTLSDRAEAYGPDFLHVRNQMVEHVIEAFLETYGLTTPRLEPGFVEMAYLDANPDVEDQVREGLWDSGFAHWLSQGKQAGRPMVPLHRSDRLVALGVY
ncbi:MAG: hypothetical protein RJA87_694 [Pseudomonadota bacterium]|jgi:hypothetical protein